VLAAGDYMLVEQCSCSAVHLTIGAVTLRLVGDRLKSAGPREAARREAGDGGSACAHVDDEALS
jgi:hypothetical protein